MEEHSPLPNILTVNEIASYMRVSKTTICRWCSSGKLRAFRIGRSWRVQRTDLEAHIQNTFVCHSESTIIT